MTAPERALREALSSILGHLEQAYAEGFARIVPDYLIRQARAALARAEGEPHKTPSQEANEILLWNLKVARDIEGGLNVVALTSEDLKAIAGAAKTAFPGDAPAPWMRVADELRKIASRQRAAAVPDARPEERA